MQRRVFLAGLAVAPLSVILPPAAPRLAICDGNSLTDCEPYAVPWTRYLAESMPGLRVVSVAVAGQGTPYLAARAPVFVDRMYEAGAAVIVWEGSNDLMTSGDTQGALGNLAAYCLRRKAVGFRVLVGTVLPRNRPASATFEDNRQALNALIRQHHRGWADGLMDVAATAIGAAGACEDSRWYYDGVHLTSDGGRLVAECAQRALPALTTGVPGTVPEPMRERLFLPRVQR